jgi:hypothetical protein
VRESILAYFNTLHHVNYLEKLRTYPEADHPPPYIAEVKKSGAVPPFPQMSSWHSA